MSKFLHDNADAHAKDDDAEDHKAMIIPQGFFSKTAKLKMKKNSVHSSMSHFALTCCIILQSIIRDLFPCW